MVDGLEEAGARVMGPVGTESEALPLIQSEEFECSAARWRISNGAPTQACCCRRFASQPVLHRLFPQAHDLAIEDENGANSFQQAISAEGLADEGRVALRQTFPTISRHKDERNITSVWPRSFNSVGHTVSILLKPCVTKGSVTPDALW